MNLLELNQIVKQEKHHTILKNINLTLAKGQAIGLRMTHSESNSLFNLILGKEFPTSGQVSIKNCSIIPLRKDDSCYEWQTVEQYLTLFQKITHSPYSLKELAFSFSLQDIWQDKIKQLSEEQKKRMILCRAFLTNADILLIENPTLNITREGSILYLSAIQFILDHGQSILFTSCYLEELTILCSEVYTYHTDDGLKKIDVVMDLDNDREKAISSEPIQTVFKISSKINDKIIFFSPEEIDFIESINGISNLRIGEESFPTTFTLNELEKKLSLFGFFRCHRSYLVNLQRIAELISYSRNSYTLILKGKKQITIPLSRSRLEQLKEKLEF